MNEEEIRVATPWFRRRWVIVTAVAAGVVVLVAAIVAAVLYMTWLTSPEKALADAAHHAMNTPGTYHITSGMADLSLRYDGTHYAASGTYKSLPFDAVIDGNTAYVRTSAPDKFVELVAPSGVPAALRPLVASVAGSFKDRWVSMPIDKLPLGGPAGSSSCLANARSQLTTNTAASGQLGGVYAANRFITTVATARQSQSVTYDIHIDSASFDAFLNALSRTDFYHSLADDCSSALQSVRESSVRKLAATVTLNSSTHALSSLAVSGLADKPLQVTANYAAVEPIAVPRDAVSYSDITSSLFTSLFRSS